MTAKKRRHEKSQNFVNNNSENFNDIKSTYLPGTIKNQNVGHNSKKEGLGLNIEK
ncbi:hypothetical protein [Anaerovorax odorimutans]|uniref:hypothetical protein n=1 Tax=Anaerovorax odorimutans TaxID=109327 RepID=UPI0004290DD1|nr:hypothetical protein [Anaerovorax odorimutans]